MKIGVLLKEVPDTESPIQIAQDGSSISFERVQWVINPYDEIALEEALRLREASGGEVLTVTVGPARAKDTLRKGLAMGADRAILVDTGGASLDPFNAARLLAKACETCGFDVIFAGKLATDDGWGQVHIGVAEIMGLPHVSPVERIEFDDGEAIATRAAEGGVKEIVRARLPAVIGCEKGLNEPRYVSLPGIMKARSKPIDVKDASERGEASAPTIVRSGLSEPPVRGGVRMIEGAPQTAADELARLLREVGAL